MYNRNEQEQDIWTYTAQRSSYKVQKIYKLLMGHQPIQPTLKWLWSYCQPKHRVFFWLLMNDRLSTKNIPKRRKMQLESFNCAFCGSAQEETVLHLFWGCPYAQKCWGTLELQIAQDGETLQNIHALRTQLQSEGPKTATRGGVNGSRKFSSIIFSATIPNHRQTQNESQN